MHLNLFVAFTCIWNKFSIKVQVVVFFGVVCGVFACTLYMYFKTRKYKYLLHIMYVDAGYPCVLYHLYLIYVIFILYTPVPVHD